MLIPIVRTSSLWHIGDLDNNTQGARESFEGNLLSASACPNAWQAIARLGGGKYYERAQENRLVDVHHALQNSRYAPLCAAVEQWAIKSGYLKPGVIYVYHYEDGEAEGDDAAREIHFGCKEEALSEADGDESLIEKRTLLLAQPVLLSMHGLTERSASMGRELALIEWVRMHGRAQGINGVYWDERLDELALSAPRAGIFSTEGFELRSNLPDDEDCLRVLRHTEERLDLGPKHRDVQEGPSP